MFVGGVVDDQVEDEPDASLLGFAGQLREVTRLPSAGWMP